MSCVCSSKRGAVGTPVKPEKAADAAKAFALVLKGVVEGELQDLAAAAKDVKVVFGHISDAVELFERLTLSSTLDALQELSNALRGMSSVLSDADPMLADLKRISDAAEQLRNPKEFFHNVGVELVLNGKDILELTGHIVLHAKANEWEILGADLGNLIEMLTAPAPVDAELPWPLSACAGFDASNLTVHCAPTSCCEAGHDCSKCPCAGAEGAVIAAASASTVQERELLDTEALESILSGFIAALLPETYSLSADAPIVLRHVRAAVDHFKQLTARSFADGLEELSAALCEIRAVLIRAGASQLEVERLTIAAKQMKSPKEFMLNVGKELVLDAKEILSVLESLVNHAGAKDWEGVGADLGLLVEILTTPAPLDASYPWPFSLCCEAGTR